MLTGRWINFQELEENITLEELQLILDASRRLEHRRNQFAAALKGHDIGEYEGTTDKKETVEEITRRTKIRAAARLNNMEPEEYEMRSLGFGFD